MLQGSFFPKAILSSLFFCLLQIGLPAQNPRPRTPLSLEQALHLIRDTYQVQVAYDPEAVEGLFTSAPLPNGTLVAALDAVLRNTGLSYRLLKPDQVLIRAVIPLQTPNIPILSGVVRDKHTGEPLPFASVFHPKSRTGTVSNAQGLFSIALDNTTDSSYLDISYLGYTHQQVALQQFQTSGELTVLMEPQVLEFIPVVVTDRLPIVSAIPSEHAIRINPATFGALPTLAGINDPMRKLQLLPGVMASNDISAGLKIRGAKASENMVLLDGIPLIQVDHFLGIFSAVNGAIVDQIDLYKNAFPVEYGGRTAGLIDIRTQNPQTSKLTGGVQLNNLSADAWLLAPLGSKSGLSLAGRTTFDNAANSGLFDYVNPSKILEEELPNNFRSVFSADPSFRFHDANAKWSWSPDSSLYAEANYFQSKDNYTYAFEKTFINFLDRKPIRNTELFDEESQWRNSGYSFQLKKDWSDRLTSKLVLSGSDFNSDNRVESKVFRQGIALIDTLQTGFASTQEVLTRDVNWKNDWQWRPGHELSFGYQFTGYQVSSDFTQGSTNYFSKAQKAGLHTGFAQWQADYPGGWLLSAALRSTWYSPTQKMYFSPRINLSRKIEERLVVKGFTGLDYQFLQEATHENQFGRTASFWMLGGEAPFPVARSSQWMAGFSIPGNTLKFDLEFYQNHTVGI
ncbi:MAG: TonB-dependent receptor, partial [Saprospiraceae bacterium]|nr:TonB-dependent receptor [Saprospiraceae bacterium]